MDWARGGWRQGFVLGALGHRLREDPTSGWRSADSPQGGAGLKSAVEDFYSLDALAEDAAEEDGLPDPDSEPEDFDLPHTILPNKLRRSPINA